MNMDESTFDGKNHYENIDYKMYSLILSGLRIACIVI